MTDAREVSFIIGSLSSWRVFGAAILIRQQLLGGAAILIRQ
jgi:hypothetical protein